jgi:hypothetical protein
LKFCLVLTRPPVVLFRLLGGFAPFVQLLNMFAQQFAGGNVALPAQFQKSVVFLPWPA